jgi:pimeloyl-[acyl-carrier protein] methyl ester esterase
MMLHVTLRGRGDPLVLLHGWALNGGVFQALLPELARKHEVWVVDLPGHGDSMPADAATLDAWVTPILAVVPERAHWLGWSLGGMLALAAADAEPERISGLTLIGSTPCFTRRADWAHGVDSGLLTELADDLAQDYARTVARFLSLQVLGSVDARSTLRSLNEALRRAPRPSDEGLRQGLALLSASDLRGRMPQGLPLRVVAGSKDRLTPPAAARWLTAQVEGAMLTEIADAGHAPFITHRAQCVAHLSA